MAHRVYEDGKELNRLVFAMKDEDGKYPNYNVLTSVRLFILEVPEQEREIEVSNFGYSETPNEIYGRYNTDSSTFEFDPPVFQSEYGGSVDGSISAGTYRLDVVDINGVSHSKTYDFNGLLDIPVIRSTSFRAKKDNVELEFRWDLPDEWFNTATRTYAILNAYADGTYVGQLYVRIPSDIEFISVPTSFIEQSRRGETGLHLQFNLERVMETIGPIREK